MITLLTCLHVFSCSTGCLCPNSVPRCHHGRLHLTENQQQVERGLQSGYSANCPLNKTKNNVTHTHTALSGFAKLEHQGTEGFLAFTNQLHRKHIQHSYPSREPMFNMQWTLVREGREGTASALCTVWSGAPAQGFPAGRRLKASS